jgi:EAL and modified HD-GYP domain-containing signal transduction protein
MSKIYVARQKIINSSGRIFSYALCFRDKAEGIEKFPSSLAATSRVLMNVLTNMEFDQVVTPNGIAFIKVDDKVLDSKILEILDKKRFVLEILVHSEVDEHFISNLRYLHQEGFKIALGGFDCSAESIKKFSAIFKYIHIIKVDIQTAQSENIEKVVPRLKKMNLKLLAEKIETKEEFRLYNQMGFNLFQGFYIHKPELMEQHGTKDVTQVVIIELINLIKNEGETKVIEAFVKKRPDIVYKLIRFLNNRTSFASTITSISQIITLLGRDELLKWLLVYLYAEVSDNEISTAILDVALQRAESMQERGGFEVREEAYLVGMFSMLDILFDTKFSNLTAGVPLDRNITDAIVRNQGPYAKILSAVKKEERARLKDVVMDNFDKISIEYIIYSLELSKIKINHNSFAKKS